MIAWNTATGVVDGVMINEDFSMPPPAEYHALPAAEWRATRSIFKELHTRFNGHHVAEPGTTMHCLYFTCTRLSVRGQGVMQGLWRETIAVARDYSYGHIVAEAGREEVRQVLDEKLGFREVAAVRYDEPHHHPATAAVAPAAASSTGSGSGSGSGSASEAARSVFAKLREVDPVQYTRLSLHLRNVPSDLY